jgi:hypothetical protein
MFRFANRIIRFTGFLLTLALSIGGAERIMTSMN